MRPYTYMLMLTMFISLAAIAQDKVKGPERWEDDIAKFEAQDKETPPPQGEILFLGSSSIRGWDLEKWFPKHTVINRGFGGSKIADSVYHFDRLVLPYKPKYIVFYAGDNDIGGGMKPQKVFWDYMAFVKKVHDALPETKIIFVAIKPSIKRWDKIENIRKANHSIEEWSNNYPYLKYLDIDTPMIGADGMPKKELFKDDGLHMNEKGYELWTTLLLDYLPPK